MRFDAQSRADIRLLHKKRARQEDVDSGCLFVERQKRECPKYQIVSLGIILRDYLADILRDCRLAIFS